MLTQEHFFLRIARQINTNPTNNSVTYTVKKTKIKNKSKPQNMMNLQLKGDWNKLSGLLKEKYGDLTDDDLKIAEGKAEELIGILQEKTGKGKDKLIEELEELESKVI